MTIKSFRSRKSERGNVFFTLFGAVAIVGVLGAGIMATMRGPLSTMVNVNRRTQAEADMSIAAKLILLEAAADTTHNGDCDGDTFVEPMEYEVGTPAPTGGGHIPGAIGSNKVDAWGTPFGYCSWDAGTIIDDVGNATADPDACDTDSDTNYRRLAGKGNSDSDYMVIALVSAGANQEFETTCAGGANPAISKTAGSDDFWVTHTYATAVAATGGLWTLKANEPGVAVIAKDIEAQGATFTGPVDLSASASMFLPNETVATTCNAANIGIVRVNTATDPDSLEVCDDAADDGVTGPFTWQSVAAGAAGLSLWQQNAGDLDEIYYDTDNVGIGVADPTEALDVDGNVKLTEDILLATGSALIWGATGAHLTEGTNLLELGYGLSEINIGSATGIDITGDTTITGSTTGVTAVDALTVTDSAASVIFTVQNDGMVGIGNANPNDKLDVSGSIDATEHYKLDGVNFLTDNAAAGTTIIGKGTGTGVTGINNTILGGGAGATLVGGKNNILIGSHDVTAIDVPLATTENYLNIGNLIFGDLANKRVGIGTDTLTDALEVAGNIDASGNIEGTDIHATQDITAARDITATRNILGVDITASGTVHADVYELDGLSQDFSDIPDCDGVTDKIVWTAGTGWDCATDQQGGSGGGAPDLADVLAQGDDANDQDAVNFSGIAIGSTTIDGGGAQPLVLDADGAIGADFFCDDSGNNCFTASTAASGGTAKLNTITAADGNNTIGSADWNQIWNWQLSGAETAFIFGENVASSGGTIGASGDQFILKAGTLATSTATPLVVTNLGTANSFRVNDETGDADTSPFVIEADGDVGIGTASPAGRLHIMGTAPHIQLGDNTQSGVFRVYSGSGTNKYINMTYDAFDRFVIAPFVANQGFFIGPVTGASNFARVGINVNAAGASNDTFQLMLNGTAMMNMTSTGEFGIGDTTPDDGSGSGGQNLLVDIGGPLGTTYYCDENGLNCFTAASVAGSGLWEKSGTVIRTRNPAVYATDDFVFGAAQLADIVGTDDDNRMFFDKSKGAFRAGAALSTQWDDASIGNYSAALGVNTVASGNYSTALGASTTASGHVSTTMGTANYASGDYSVAFGNYASVGDSVVPDGTGNASVAFGLIDSGVTITVPPKITGIQSMGIFMGDQDGVDVTANNLMALLGGRFVIDPDDTSATNLNVSTGVQQLELDVQGDIGAINYCDEAGNNCFTPASVATNRALSAITAATAANSINNADHAQVWNWNLTTNDKDAFTFTENTASTATGHSSILKAGTLATSTAVPLRITNLGDGDSFVVNDETGDADATPFVINATGGVSVGALTADDGAKPHKFAVVDDATFVDWYDNIGQFQIRGATNSNKQLTVGVETNAATSYAWLQSTLNGTAARPLILQPDPDASGTGGVGIGDITPDDGTGGGGQNLLLDVEGAIGGSHYCDQNGLNCFTPSSIASNRALSAITAATADNSINSGNWNQVWNWQLAGAETAFTFGENTASSGGTIGASGNQFILKAETLATSTATPLVVTNLGTANSFRVNDATGDADTTPFVIDEAGEVGIGTATPGVQLQIHQPTGSFPKMRLTAADVTTAVTSGSSSVGDVSATNTIGQIRNRMDGGGVQTGGMLIQGFTGSGVNNYYPLHLLGMHGGTAPTTAAVTIGGQKWSGTNNRSALDGTTPILDIENNYATAGTGGLVMRVMGDGKVGIGVATPSTALHVDGSATIQNGTLFLPVGAIPPNLSMAFTGDTDTGFYNAGDGTFYFVSNGTALFQMHPDRFRINSATAQIEAGFGTAGNPTYSFDSDDDNGMYHPAADSLGFSTAGTERIHITSTGDVGIGLSNPASRFVVAAPSTEVIGAGAVITANACGTVKRVSATANRTTDTTDTFTTPTASYGGCCMDVVNVDTVDTITLDNNANFITGPGTDLTLGPGKAVRVCSDGTSWYQAASVTNVASGGNIPLSGLTAAIADNTINSADWNQVWNWQLAAGEVGLTIGENVASTGGSSDQYILAAKTLAASTATPFMITNLGAADSFRVNDETGDADATPFIIKADGRIGIGGTAPGQKLSVAGRIETQGGMLFNQGSGPTDNLIYVGGTSAGAVDASFGFFTAGIGSGNATDGPYFLSRGNTYSASAQRGNFYFVAGNPSTPSSTEGSINFWTGNEQSRMVIKNDGNIGIGWADPTVPMIIAKNSPSSGWFLELANTDNVGSSNGSFIRHTLQGTSEEDWGSGADGRGYMILNETDGAVRMLVNNDGDVGIGDYSVTSPASKFVVASPTAEVIGAAATITANACGTVKQVSATANRTTNTTDTFTAPTASYGGCCMDVVNVDTVDTITLDQNAKFITGPGTDLALGPGKAVRVCSDGTSWYQASTVSSGSIPVMAIDDLTDAFTDYAVENNLIMGRTSAAALAAGAQRNVFIGQGAGATAANSTANTDSNTAVGYTALRDLTTGNQNTAVGRSALSDTTDGAWNVAVGNQALQENSVGNGNVAIGTTALYSNVANSESTAIGYGAMFYADDTATGAVTYNTAVGAYSLQGSATAANNTGIGNTAIGHSALMGNTSGTDNTAVGREALQDNTTGIGNIAIGYAALHNNDDGDANLAFGYQAMNDNVSGNNNVAIGEGALLSNNSRAYNTAIGHRALMNAGSATDGNWSANTAVGALALQGSGTPANNTGEGNTAVGYSALAGYTSGEHNTALGLAAGDSITTGSSNILIGYDVDTPAATTSSHLNIGGTIFGDLANDNVRIGGSGAVAAGPLVAIAPASEVVAGAAVITANACGSVKQISAGGNVTTDTTDTFTTPTAAYNGCCMDVVNIDSADTITLDANARFLTGPGTDLALQPGKAVRVCSNGTTWYQAASVTSVASGGNIPISGLTAAIADNSINSGNWNQVWNWQLAGAETALVVGENVASSGGTVGASGDQFLMKASTLATSTATPLVVTNLGTANSFRVNDETGDADTTPFVITASGGVGIGTAAPETELHIMDPAGATYLTIGNPNVVGSDASDGYIKLYGENSGVVSTGTINMGSTNMFLTAPNAIYSSNKHVVSSGSTAGNNSFESLTLLRHDSNSAASNGIGSYMNFLLETSVNDNLSEAARIEAVFDDADDNSKDSSLRFYTMGPNALSATTTPTERVRIDSSGNVGIGTSTPRGTLNLQQSAGDADLVFTRSDSKQASILYNAGGTKLDFRVGGLGGTDTGSTAMGIGDQGYVVIGNSTPSVGKFVVTSPASEVIAAAATITANACGTVKQISATANRTTNTTDTFTAPTASYNGCCMDVVNVDTVDTITLDSNAKFITGPGTDLAVGPGKAVRVCSDGTSWYQASTVSSAIAAVLAIDDLSDAYADYTTLNNLIMGRAGAAALTAGAVANVFIGENAGATTANSTATTDYNTAVGYQALMSLTSGMENTAIGESALRSTTTAAENAAFGSNSLDFNVSGSQNTAYGDSTLRYNVGRHESTAIGYQAMMNANSAAGSATTYNTAVGAYALTGSATPADNTGTANTAIGHGALRNATSGGNNTALGRDSLGNTTSGYSNTAIGSLTLSNNDTGQSNVAIGYGVLVSNTASHASTGVGAGALGISTGGRNTALGAAAGDSITTGTDNIVIGYDIDTPAATTSSHLNIGGTIFGDVSTDNVRIGGSGAVGAGPFIAAPPTTEVVAAAAVITANACGSIKQISATANRTTDTTDTFTAPTAAYNGCCMDVVNVDTVDTITLDQNAKFFTGPGTDLALGPGKAVRVCSDGTSWYQAASVTSVASGGNIPLSGLTAAIAANSINNADYAQTWNWQVTTNDKDAFTFTENTASTATGHSSILKAATLATSTATPLMVTNLGASDSFRVNDETGDNDTSPFIVKNDGKVGIGTQSPSQLLEVYGTTAYISLLSNGEGAVTSSAAASNWWDNGGFNASRSRGTIASPTAVQSGDSVLTMWGTAYDGDTWETPALMQYFVDGTPGDGDMPGRIEFQTQPDGSAINPEATTPEMVIKNDGTVGIGVATPTTGSKLDVYGPIFVNGDANASDGDLFFGGGAWIYGIGTGWDGQNSNLRLNPVGTAGGTADFRDVSIYDGKTVPFAYFQGSTKRFSTGGNDTTPDAMLEVIKDSTSPLLMLSSAAANNGDLMIMDTNGQVGIGTTSPSEKLHISGSTETAIRISSATNSALSNSEFEVSRARGTIAAPTVVQDGDAIFGIWPEAYDGNSYEIMGLIQFEIDGTPGDGDMPGRIEFHTQPDGSAANPESGTPELVIKNDGAVGIGIASPASKFVVAAPSTEVIGAAAVITADACGTVKRLSATANRTTDTTDTFTTPTASYNGCCMDVVNVDTVDTITLDSNGNFFTGSGTDVALGPGKAVRVCSDGTDWYQAAAVSNASSITVSALDDLTDAYTDYVTSNNMIIGRAGAAALTAGAEGNVFIGQGAGATTANSSATTDKNTALGYLALTSLTDGVMNTAIGESALRANTTGSFNVGLGAGALFSNTTGSQNIAIGTTAAAHAALEDNTTGSKNVAIGEGAMSRNTTKQESTAIGHNAMLYADSAAGGAITYNTAVGAYSLKGSATAADNTGTRNTAIGHSSLTSNTIGLGNVAIGDTALASNDEGNQNTAVGSQTLVYNTWGNANTALGNLALGSSQTGSNNTGLGMSALGSSQTGSNNVAVGYNAGLTLTTGGSNILVGTGADTPANNTSNHLNIGGTIFGDVSTDNVRIGGSGVVSVGPLVATPPATEVIAAAAVITANACGTIKQIDAASSVTTNTTNTFTAPTGYSGCCMDVVNVDTVDTITLDANALFLTGAGTDLALAPGKGVRVCSDGAAWYQAGGVSSATAGGVVLSSITAATGANSINSGDNAQVWNWQLTTADKDAFTFTENAASTATGHSSILKASAIATSTAVPLRVTNLGAADSFIVNDETGDNDTTPFVIQADGDVGIGTATPGRLLHVAQNNPTNGWLFEIENTDNVGGSTGAWMRYHASGTNDEEWGTGSDAFGFSIYNATDAAYRVTVDNAGNVGIGTNAPDSSAKLDVRGPIFLDGLNDGSTGDIFIGGGGWPYSIGVGWAGQDSSLRFNAVGTAGGTADFRNIWFYDGKTNPVARWEGSTKRMSTGGNDSTPDAMLEVIKDSTSPLFMLSSAAANNGDLMIVDTNGNVGIGLTSPASKFVVAPPSSEVVAAAATITANACGTVKQISATANRTTNTTDTFTTPTASYAGCCMDVVNIDTVDTITLDQNGNFFTGPGTDIALGPGQGVRVCSDGTDWYQAGGVSSATAGGGGSIDGLTDALAERSTRHNLMMGNPDASYANLVAGTGQWNVGIGESTLTSLTHGHNNVGVGPGALNATTTGDYNTAMGGGVSEAALQSNTEGDNNTAYGSSTLGTNVANSESTAIGFSAMRYANSTATGITTYNTALGAYALRGSTTAANNTGIKNTAIGHSALLATTSGSDNTAVGELSMTSNTTGYDNAALGTNTLNNNTTGYGNTAIGDIALYYNVAKRESTAIGYYAMHYADSTGTGAVTYNTAVGAYALRGSTTAANNIGTSNTALGHSALLVTTSGSSNVAVGSLALSTNANGSLNTALGTGAMQNSSSGGSNTAVGASALLSNTSGSNNTAMGYLALTTNVTKIESTALGYSAMRYADSAAGGAVTNNTAVGAYALRGSTTAANNTGISNTAIGHSALRLNTSGQENTAVGDHAMDTNSTGQANTTLGFNTMYFNDTGGSNVAIGNSALAQNVAKSQSTAVGAYAMQYAHNTSSGSNTANTALGYYALRGSTTAANNTGINNTAIGHSALTNVTSGVRNIGLGVSAGDLITTGTDNIIIGYDIDPPANNSTYHLNIGGTIFGDTQNDRVRIGGSGAVAVGPLVATPPATEVIAAAAVITADACGTIKQLSATANRTTNTTNTFTAPTGYGGCCMDVVNVDTVDTITLDANALFLTGAGTDVALAPGKGVRVCSDGAAWYQAGDVSSGGGGGSGTIDGLTDAYADYTTLNNLIMGRTSAAALTAGAQYNVFIGETAGATSANSTSATDANTAVGHGAMAGLTSGSNNTAVGRNAMGSGVLSTAYNVAVGDAALYALTTGGNNVAVGYSAMLTNQTGESNTAIGNLALRDSTASYNTALGASALRNNSTGTASVGIGSDALANNTTGRRNVAIGYNAMQSNVTKQESVAIGFQAMEYADSAAGGAATNNTAVGANALRGSSTAANNTGVGNTAIGHGSLSGNTSGVGNSALGYATLTNNTTGNNNIAIGYQALQANTSGSTNVAIGDGTMNTNTTRAYNTAVGYRAMLYASSSAGGEWSGNTALGSLALQGSSTAANNSGQYNTAVGYSALTAYTSGTNNTAMGLNALSALTTGSNNTGIGLAAGDTITTGTDNILIGYASDTPANNTTYHLNIGDTIFGDLQNDRVRIGGSGVVSVGPLVATPPATEVIAAAAVITANACGTIKQISATANRTTNTTNTFTAPTGYAGCCMDVVNVDTVDTITLDANALFLTGPGTDVALAPGKGVRVCSDGAAWYQAGGVSSAAAGSTTLSGITAAGGANSINSGDNAQTWNWQLTTADKDAFTFTENTASTATGHSSILKAATLATSTATPLMVTNLGAANSFVVNDETGDADTTPFVIAADGKVGIGENVPSYMLDIYGTDAAANIQSDGEGIVIVTGASSTHAYVNAEFSARRSRGTIAAPSVVQSGDAVMGLWSEAYDSNSWEVPALIQTFVDGTPGDGDMPGRIEFQTQADGAAANIETSTPEMVIKNTGFVGIGIAAPTQKLQVASDGENGIGVRVAGTSAGWNPFYISERSRGTLASPTIVSSGDVISEHIYRAYDGGAYEDAAYIGVYVDGTPGASDMPGRIEFNTQPDGSGAWMGDGNTTSEMVIKSTGFVGIGIDAPTDLLHVSRNQNGSTSMRISNTTAGASAEAQYEIQTDVGTVFMGMNSSTYASNAGDAYLINTANTDLRFATNNTYRMKIQADGDIGINNDSPNVELDVVGDIEYTGTIADVSDIRLKKDIHPLTDRGSMLEKLNRINTYSFTMKQEKTGRVEFGVMAQELEKIFPELVTTAKDEMGTKSVNYVGMIAPMIEAGKELEAQNKALKAEIDALKAQQDEMKQAMNDITEDMKGMKVHTGYGIGKAEMSLLMILAALGTLGGVGIFRRRSGQPRQ